MTEGAATLLRGADRAALVAAFGDRLRKAGAAEPTTALADLCEAWADPEQTRFWAFEQVSAGTVHRLRTFPPSPLHFKTPRAIS